MGAFAFSTLLTAIASFVLSIFVIYKQRTLLNKLWFGVGMATALWSFGLYGVVVSVNEKEAFIWQHILDIGGILIPFLFFNFILVLLGIHEQKKREYRISYILAFILLGLSFTPLFKAGMKPLFEFNYWINPGPLYIFFPIIFAVFAIYAVYLMISRYRNLDLERKNQVKYILLMALIGYGGGITNFLPQIAKVYPFGNYLVIFYIVAITYAITKHKLFDVKVFAVALFGTALVAFSFIEILLAQGVNSAVFRSIIFVFTAAIAYLLIKSVIKDIKQKEQLEKLTTELTQVNQSLEQATLKLQASNKGLAETGVQLRSANTLLDVRNKHLETLQKFSNIILQSYRLEEMSQRIIDYIPQEIENCDIAFLGLVDVKANAIVGHAISKPYTVARQVFRLLGDNLAKYKIPLTDKNNLLVKMIKDKQLKTTESLYDFLGPVIPKPVAWALQNLAGGMSMAVAVPLVVRGQAQGALVMTFNKKRAALTKEDMTLFLAIADQVGIALERTRVYEELASLNTRLNEANHYLKDLDQAKTDFLNLASHQLRTPTTGVKGFLSMLLDGDYGKVSVKQKEVLDMVYAETNRLIRLINVFLNVSRIESGSFKLVRTDLDMIKLANTVITELIMAAQGKKLELKLNAPKKLPTISADADKIHDVLLNLVDNAVKYTEKGSVTVNITLTDEDIKTSVTDTGMGLTKDEIQHLFAKFGRTERVKLVDSQGTGLGLFIAKRIIEAHGGVIGVTSPGEGKGTTFYFTLPLHPPVTATAMATLPAEDLVKVEKK